jgi:hypothetical protein
MAKKPSSNPFSGAMADWEPLPPSTVKSLDTSDRPLSKPDRVAKEHNVLLEKYIQGTREQSRPFGGAGTRDAANSTSVSGHVTLVRAKKKGALDNDVNAKTFVISGDKIIGSQG